MESTSFQSRMHVMNPGVLQLYSFPTPNGIKVAAILEEICELRANKGDLLPESASSSGSSSSFSGSSLESFSSSSASALSAALYEPHLVNIRVGENRLKWYSSIFASQKIPGIVDPHGPGGTAVTMFESGAILNYLAHKYKALLPMDDCLTKLNTLTWLFWGSATLSNQFKSFGFYYKYCSHALPYCVERYTKEVHRLLGVLDHQLQSHGKHWVVGDSYSIADVSMWPWVHALFDNYDNAGELVFGIRDHYPHVHSWYQRCMERPASKRALQVCNLNVDST